LTIERRKMPVAGPASADAWDGPALGRRALFAGAGAAIVARPAWAAGARLDALAQAARGEPPPVWYETSPQEQLDRIARLYGERFPGLRLRPLRLIGGGELAARIVQEVQAGAPSADIGTSGLDQVWQLAERGMLIEEDWAALGVPAPLTLSRFAVTTASAIHGILYNTRLVPPDAVPQSWDDLLDRRWAGRVGNWSIATPLVMLAQRWGRERTERFVERLAAQQPYLYKSMFGLAQGIVSGEVTLGLVAYHSALPSIAAGAPVRMVMPDPIPVSSLASFVTRASRSPNASRLLLAWLASAEGAVAYEAVSGRGVHAAHATRTAAMIAGRQTAEYLPTDRDVVNPMRTQFNRLLAAAGKPVD